MGYYNIIMNWNKSYKYLSKKRLIYLNRRVEKSVKNPGKILTGIIKYNLI